MAIEETMSQLAHSQVTQSLPSIAEDIQGFQLIDNNEENNSVVGVLVAFVGDTCVYIPVIYRKGKIFNTDIMYIPELKQWLPTQDNWITYLKSHKSGLIEATRIDKGINAGGNAASEITLDLPFQHITKSASANGGLRDILKNAKKVMVGQLSEPVPAIMIPTAPEVLSKCASSKAMEIINSIAEYPSVNNAFVEFYSDAEIMDMVNRVAESVKDFNRTRAERLASHKKTGEVKLLTSSSTEARDLTPEQKVKLLRDGAVIVDKRGLKPSKIFKTRNNGKWTTCTTAGLYELLKRDGNTVTALVAPRNNKDTRFMHNRSSCLVVPLDDGQSRTACIVDDTPIGQPYPFNFSGNLTSISKGIDSIGTQEGTSSYVLVTAGGDVIEISAVGKPYWASDEDGNTRVSFDNNFYVDHGVKSDNAKVIEELPEGAKVRVKSGVLFVPKNIVVFKIDRENKGTNLNLATVEEVVEAVASREKLTKVKLFNDNNRITISDETNVTAPLGKAASEMELVKKYAISPEDAEIMVKEASMNPRKNVRYLVKISSDTAYAMMVNDQPATETSDTTINLNNVLPADDRKLLEEAANSGVKEVVDVSVLKTLATDDSSVKQVQEFLPKLFTAMDAIARLLFMIRAGNAFDSSYGEARASDLEGQLSKLLSNVGDIIICLQQGRVDSVNNLLEGPLADSIG